MNHSTAALNAPSLAAVTAGFVYAQRRRMSVNVKEHDHMKTNQVAARSESVVSPLPVGAFVPRPKIRELLVRSHGHRIWEQFVELAGVEEQRCFAFLDVGLSACWSAGVHRHPGVAHFEILRRE
jgi:hypothetical protein